MKLTKLSYCIPAKYANTFTNLVSDSDAFIVVSVLRTSERTGNKFVSYEIECSKKLHERLAGAEDFARLMHSEEMKAARKINSVSTIA